MNNQPVLIMHMMAKIVWARGYIDYSAVLIQNIRSMCESHRVQS